MTGYIVTRSTRGKASEKALCCFSSTEKNSHPNTTASGLFCSILFNSILSNSLLSEAVEKIYNAYPRKKGKGQAVRAIRSAIKKIEPVLLLEAVHKYADSVAGQAPQYIPYPATWFNGERWLDEPEKSKDEQMIETAKKFMMEASNGTGAFYENNALPAKDV